MPSNPPCKARRRRADGTTRDHEVACSTKELDLGDCSRSFKIELWVVNGVNSFPARQSAKTDQCRIRKRMILFQFNPPEREILLSNPLDRTVYHSTIETVASSNLLGEQVFVQMSAKNHHPHLGNHPKPHFTSLSASWSRGNVIGLGIEIGCNHLRRVLGP